VKAVSSVTDSRVTSLNLRNLTISSYSPLRNLIRLNDLSIIDCDLAPLPDWIGEFDLVNLNLSGSNLDSIPSSIGTLYNLKSLYLEDNNLQKLPDLHHLSKLIYLTAHSNRLTDLPDSMYLMKNEELTTNFWNNRICTLSDSNSVWADEHSPNLLYNQVCISVPNDTVVVREILEANNLELEIRADANWIYFFNGRVQQLYLNNYEVKTIPASIGQLDELYILELNNCKLDSLPSSICDLDQLLTLRLENCQISTLPDSIVKLTNVLNLDLNRNLLCNLSGPVLNWVNEHCSDPDWSNKQLCINASDMVYLQEILVANSIDLDRIDAVVTSTNNGRITSLNLSNRNIRVIPQSIQFLDKIHYLNLCGNTNISLPSTSKIYALPEIDSLDLSNCNLSSITDYSDSYQKLKYLNLSNNKLTRFPQSNYPELLEINAAYNPTLQTLPEGIGLCPKLEILNLYNCGLKKLPASITQLETLTSLSVDGNQLCNPPDSIGEWLDSNCTDSYPWKTTQFCLDDYADTLIVRAILDTNRWFDVKTKSVMQIKDGKIVTLSFVKSDRNFFSCLPSSISNLTSLTRLTINNFEHLSPYPIFGALTELPPEIADLPNLDTLTIINCPLKGLPEQMCNMTGLKYLYLASDALSSLPDSITRLDSLSYLNLNSNSLCNMSEAQKAWAGALSPEWENSQLCKKPTNPVSISGTSLENNAVKLDWDLSALLSYQALEAANATRTTNVEIWLSESTYPTSPYEAGAIFAGTFPAEFYEDPTTTLNDLSTNTTYYATVFTQNRNGLWSSSGPGNRCSFKTFSTPVLRDSLNGTSSLSTIALNRDQRTFNVYFRLYDNGETNDTVTMFYKLGSSASLLPCHNVSGDIGIVPGTNASALRSATWDAGAQLGEGFYSDSILIVLRTKDASSRTASLTSKYYYKIDQNKPEGVTDLRVDGHTPSSITLKWTESQSSDAESLLVALRVGTDSVMTPDSVVKRLHASDTAVTITGLTSHTLYSLGVFVKDAWNNLSDPACVFDSISFAPSCDLTPPSDNDLFDTIRIAFTISDPDSDTVTLKCEYSIDEGETWESASVSYTPKKLDIASYQGTILWLGRKDIDDADISGVRFRAIANDVLAGTGDTITLQIDHLKPEGVTGLTAQVLSSTSVKLKWTKSVSPDAEIVYIAFDQDTVCNGIIDSVFKRINASDTTLTIDGLTSHTLYRFTVAVKDSSGNVSDPACVFDSISFAPSCDLTKPSLDELNDTIEIPFTVSDQDGDDITLQCRYSLDGQLWRNASVSWTPELKKGSYEGTIQWFSHEEIDGIDISNVRFCAVANDVLKGTGDTISLHVDNYQEQTIKIETPEDIGRDVISFPYSITDSTDDNLVLQCSFSVDSGKTWVPTENVDVFSVSSSSYNDTLRWQTLNDLGSSKHNAVAFRCVLSDGHPGTSKATSEYFKVNNEGLALSVSALRILKSTTSSVTVGVRISSPQFDTVKIDSAWYSLNKGESWNAASVRAGAITRDEFDSAQIVWEFSQDVTGKHDDVMLRAFFSADTNISELDVPSFSLRDNLAPGASIDSIDINDQGDVTLYCRVTDEENDDAGIRVMYKYSGKWNEMTLRNPDACDRLPVSVKRNPVWLAPLDLGVKMPDSVLVRVIPFDVDRGKADSVKIALSDLKVPLILSGTPSGSTLSDTVKISFSVTNCDTGSLEMKLYYYADKKWNVAGGVTFSLGDSTRGTLLWPSSRVYPDMSVETVLLMLKATDSSGSYVFHIDPVELENRGVFPDYTGDFNRDGYVDILDFSHVASSWKNSANGNNMPDEIRELAPANGKAPFYEVEADSLFNYEDLGVFTSMTYWSRKNLGVRPFDAPLAKGSGTQSALCVTMEKNKDMSGAVMVLKLKDKCDGLVACRIGILSSGLTDNSIKLVDLPLFASSGNPTSSVYRNGKIVTVEAGVIPQKSVMMQENAPLMRLAGGDLRETDMTVYYELVDINHNVKSGRVAVSADGNNEMTSLKTGMFVGPNPSKVSSDMQSFVITEGVASVKRTGGCMIQLRLPGKIDSYKVTAVIYDGVGNIVRSNSRRISGNTAHIYWDGYNSNGFPVAGGTYLAVIKYASATNSGVFKSKIGIRTR